MAWFRNFQYEVIEVGHIILLRPPHLPSGTLPLGVVLKQKFDTGYAGDAVGLVCTPRVVYVPFCNRIVFYLCDIVLELNAPVQKLNGHIRNLNLSDIFTHRSLVVVSRFPSVFQRDGLHLEHRNLLHFWFGPILRLQVRSFTFRLNETMTR